MESSGASDKRASVLECGQSSAAFASRTVPCPRKIPFTIRAFRISPTEGVAIEMDARRGQAHCQSGRGLPALQGAGATAEPLPIFRALPSSSDPNLSRTANLSSPRQFMCAPSFIPTPSFPYCRRFPCEAAVPAPARSCPGEVSRLRRPVARPPGACHTPPMSPGLA